MIHQVKYWIRTTYSSVSDFNINRYFNEFCFRINSSQSNNLRTKMIDKEKVYHTRLYATNYVSLKFFNKDDIF